MGRRRRSSTGVTGFLSNVTNDIKDFVDDDVLDRGRDTERDLRRAGRNLTDDDRNGRGRGDEIDDLRQAIRGLAQKINALADSEAGSELPIAGYDDLTAVEISNRLGSLSQSDLAKVDRHERAHANRSTLTGRIEVLRGSEPWAGYDDETVVEIRKKLAGADRSTIAEVRTYEARHKNRQGVLDAASDSA